VIGARYLPKAAPGARRRYSVPSGVHSIPGWRDAMLFRDLLELPFGSGFV
jgi:hypothetical protein